MKQLYWDKVPDHNVEGTIWTQLSDANVQFDRTEFEERFASSDKKAAAAPVKAEKPKAEHAAILESKREYAINIALSRIKMTAEATRDVIMALDPAVLHEELCMVLLKIIPTPEEAEALRLYHGTGQLSKAEQFLKTIGDIPASRLEFHLLRLRYEDTVKGLDSSLGVQERAVHALAVPTNKALKRLMEVVLCLGNHMNGGTRNGQAYGFKLETLIKVNSTQGKDENLMHFLCQILQEAYPEVEGFVSDLSMLPQAIRMDSATLAADIEKFAATAAKLKVEVAKERNEMVDGFARSMKSFNDRAQLDAAGLCARAAALDIETAQLLKSFGEDPKKKKREDLLQLFNTFRNNYLKAQKELKDKRFARQKELERQARLALLAEKAALEPKGASNKQKTADDVLADLQTGNAMSLSAMVAARRRMLRLSEDKQPTSGERGSEVEDDWMFSR